MPYLYSRDPDSLVLFQFVVGRVTDQRLLMEVGRLFTDDLPRHQDMLCDYRQGDTSQLSSQVLRAVTETVREALQSGYTRRWAVVAADDLTFALARMLGLMAAGTGLDCRGFRDVDEARAWLGLPPEGRSPSLLPKAVELAPGAQLDF